MYCIHISCLLSLGANITTLATTSTLPGHTTVTPQTSVIVQGGNTTVSPGGEGIKANGLFSKTWVSRTSNFT